MTSEPVPTRPYARETRSPRREQRPLVDELLLTDAELELLTAEELAEYESILTSGFKGAGIDVTWAPEGPAGAATP